MSSLGPVSLLQACLRCSAFSLALIKLVYMQQLLLGSLLKWSRGLRGILTVLWYPSARCTNIDPNF